MFSIGAQGKDICHSQSFSDICGFPGKGRQELLNFLAVCHTKVTAVITGETRMTIYGI